MQIYNPTDNEISVVIKGNKYTINPKSTISGVPVAHANHWKSQIHNFLEVSEEDAEKKAPKEEVEPNDEELLEEIASSSEEEAENEDQSSEESEDKEEVHVEGTEETESTN